MSTTAPTRPKLLSLGVCDKPVRFRQLGMGRQGIVWTVQPGDAEAMQKGVDLVNANGGPNFWSIAQVTA